MQSRRPVSRAIDVLIELSKGVELRGTAYRNDYGDGANTHALDGRLSGPDGTLYRFSGTLSRVRFEPIERRGRPKNEGRDVALYFAFRWFCSAGLLKPQARKGVQSLWEGNGWKGCSEDTHLNALIRKGKKAVHGLSMLMHVTEAALGGAVLALPPAAFKEMTPYQRMAANGRGWIWVFGKERAQFARIEFDAPLSR